MGTDLCLYTGDENQVNRRIVNEYYNFAKKKEKNHRPESIDYDANDFRDTDLRILEEKGHTFLCERSISDIKKANINLDDLFYKKKVIICDKEIDTIINHLKNGKERMIVREEEKADFWEYYFEVRLIALCEFAYKNNYGVELSV